MKRLTENIDHIGVFVVMSSQYVKGEQAIQMGKVLPAFLPVNGKKLIEIQASFIEHQYKRFITLPEKYEVSSWEDRLLKDLSFEIIRMDDQSIEGVIRDIIIKYNNQKVPIDILYGDSIVENIPINTVAVVQRPEFYDWGEIEPNGVSSDDIVLAGRIHLRDSKTLINLLTLGKNIVDAVNILVKNNDISVFSSYKWMDFGNPETFFLSRRAIFNSRHFNNLNNDGKYVSKSSPLQQDKIINEARWLEEVPRRLRNYFPPVIEVQSNSYTIPYIPDLSLDELLVHGKLTRNDWQRVFKEMLAYFNFAIHECKIKKIEVGSRGKLPDLLFKKVVERLQQFPPSLWGDSRKFGKIEKAKIKHLVEQHYSSISEVGLFGLLHGDMVFSNIMWDGLRGRITLIDPRGQDRGGRFLQYGDIRYDLGKLFQSISLNYDWVLAGRRILGEGESLDSFSKTELIFLEELECDFQQLILSPLGVSLEEVQNIAQLLLISLIPLHNDKSNNQKIFIEIVKRNSQFKS